MHSRMLYPGRHGQRESTTGREDPSRASGEGLEAKAPRGGGRRGADHRLEVGAGGDDADLDVINLVAEATGKSVSYFVGGGEEAVPAADPLGLDEAAKRIEAAALHIAGEADRIAGLLEELRSELDRPR